MGIRFFFFFFWFLREIQQWTTTFVSRCVVNGRLNFYDGLRCRTHLLPFMCALRSSWDCGYKRLKKKKKLAIANVIFEVKKAFVRNTKNIFFRYNDDNLQNGFTKCLQCRTHETKPSERTKEKMPYTNFILPLIHSKWDTAYSSIRVTRDGMVGRKQSIKTTRKILSLNNSVFVPIHKTEKHRSLQFYVSRPPSSSTLRAPCTYFPILLFIW